MTTFRRLEVFDVSQNDADLTASPPQTNLPPASQALFMGVDSLGKFWINGAQVSGGGGSSVSVNGSAVATPNFNATTPAAPGSSTNVVWAFDGSGNISASAQLALTKTSVASNWLNSYNASTGAFTASQPAFTDISGVAVAGQIPNLDASKITTGQLALARGGTNADLSATGGASNFLRQNSSGAAITVVQPNFTDLAGSIAAGQIGSGTLTWDKLGSAAANLTLANVGFTTTFNQTSAVAWTWANTTAATSGVSQSSPIITINGTYWTGAASATDSWTIQNVNANGTNGTSQLTLAHSGSTGIPTVVFPLGSAGTASGYSIGFTGSTAGIAGTANGLALIGAAGSGWATNFYGGSTAIGQIVIDSTNVGLKFGTAGATGSVWIGDLSNGNRTTVNAVAAFGTQQNNQWKPTAGGPAFGVSIGGGRGPGTQGQLGFAPASGAVKGIALGIEPTVNQTSTATGDFTCLHVNLTNTAFLGTNLLLLDAQVGGVSLYKIDSSGQTTEATANGATWTHGQASELLTLSTVGLTTDTAANLLPANSIIESVVCRVTTTITVTTNWAVGDSVQSARFSSPNATLTAGTTSVGLNQADPTVASANLGPVQSAAAKVRITCTGSNPGAGVIRITVFYRQFVAPTS